MNEYWKKRNSELLKIHAQKADDIERELIKEYERSLNGIKKEIETFYARYAGENGISMAEARKQLSREELKGFKMSLEEFREKALDNADGKWTTMLDNEYMRSRVSRLEALKYQMRGEVELLKQKQEDKFSISLEKAYSDTYYTTHKHIADSVDYAVNFAKFDRDTVKNAIYEKWLDGSNFSDRIWNDKQKLLRELNTNLVHGITRGDSPDKMIKNISARMNVSKSRSAALYQTEYTHIMVDARLRSIMDAGCDEYEIDENMDSDICDECASMHGKHFKLSEYQQGITAPPFHTRCRGTITAYFADDDLDNSDVDDIIEVDKDNMDLMKSPFTDKKRKAVLSHASKVIYGNLKIPVKKVSNSHCDLYVEDSIKANDKVIRLYEEIISATYPYLKNYVELSQIILVDFGKYGIGTGENTEAIGGYNDELRKIMLNSKFNTAEKILDFVGSGNFANNEVISVVLHEAGHKYYYDSIRKLAEKSGISKTEAKNKIDQAIEKIIKTQIIQDSRDVQLAISPYAGMGYTKRNFSEVTAECMASIKFNDISRSIIDKIERMTK